MSGLSRMLVAGDLIVPTDQKLIPMVATRRRSGLKHFHVTSRLSPAPTPAQLDKAKRDKANIKRHLDHPTPLHRTLPFNRTNLLNLNLKLSSSFNNTYFRSLIYRP
jgi:hypothetical protein